MMRRIAAMLKRLIAFISVASILFCCSCSSEQILEHSDTVVFNDGTAVAGASIGQIDLDKLSSLSGLTIEHKSYLRDETVLKILAGDDDIDVYIMSADELQSLKDQGIYCRIESDIVADFNAGCFDYLNEYCMDGEGYITAMPISASVTALVCPKDAIEETDLTASDIEYYDDFIAFLANYKGDRKSYCWTCSPFFLYQYQYEEYYCDFANRVCNYETDMYYKLYNTLEGWLRYAQEPGSPEYFTHGVSNTYEPSLNLFSFDSFNSFINSSYHTDVNEWRAFAVPKISHEVESTYANAYFAVINPYSKNKDAAVEAIEAIAENYFRVLGYYGNNSMIRKDKTEYPDNYFADSELFDDFFTIATNSFLAEYSLFSNRNDIDMYQRGEITIDEAIAMYQREVEIWLNE